MRKSLTLLPAGVLAAVIIGSACAPPQPPQQPPPTPPTTPPGSTGCAAPSSVKAGPDSADPISSWGVDGVGRGQRRHRQRRLRRRHVQQRRVADRRRPRRTPTWPRSAWRTAACSNTFNANFGGGPVNALATDGSNLFVGGNFTTLNGGAVNRLVKLNASGVRDTGFAPAPIPRARRSD